MAAELHSATPNDSRYVPFTQQDWCCVPTSIQIVMYRLGIPLLPAEEIGFHIGLTVPPDQVNLFYDVRTSDEPPTAAGYGTQISTPGFGLNDAFKKLDIPLSFNMRPISSITDAAELVDVLRNVEAADSDALLCFNHGHVNGKYEPFSGHVTVFDRVIDGKVRIVDASWKQPKWRFIDSERLYEALRLHGDENSGGIWHLERVV